MSEHQLPPIDEFDLRVRAALAHAYDTGPAPTSLLRQPGSRLTPVARWVAAAACVVLVAGVTAFSLRPAELVSSAIAHDHAEQGLRGEFVEAPEFAARLGLPRALPGVPQLTRPCRVGGKRAWHLMTYFENAGMVSVFAFEEAVVLPEASSGWWANARWRVLRSPGGRPLLVVGASRAAVDVAANALKAG